MSTDITPYGLSADELMAKLKQAEVAYFSPAGSVSHDGNTLSLLPRDQLKTMIRELRAYLGLSPHKFMTTTRPSRRIKTRMRR
ncbi:hypothetical protein [Sulfitobacter guttiformis]|uniref:Uncharacterized protein n=1 Tax=Sulfitobacter guttiformis TaxID=74349 RepID=A0A420DHC1_9RHOB|nr:hypothetical protein [Sulfitobacter guttiformis]KIN72661.1 hypothetical protein Z949_1839 [Sulfitobacter guttiformis KCTC 32187]RKE93610.1 hypothetical protein C8N30_2687 [Sulfitobacter guttiformis]